MFHFKYNFIAYYPDKRTLSTEPLGLILFHWCDFHKGDRTMSGKLMNVYASQSFTALPPQSELA